MVPALPKSVLAVSPLMLVTRRTRRGGHGEDVARSEAEKPVARPEYRRAQSFWTGAHFDSAANATSCDNDCKAMVTETSIMNDDRMMIVCGLQLGASTHCDQ